MYVLLHCSPGNITDLETDSLSVDLHPSTESTYTATSINPARDSFTTRNMASLHVPVRGARGGAPITKAVILV